MMAFTTPPTRTCLNLPFQTAGSAALAPWPKRLLPRSWPDESPHMLEQSAVSQILPTLASTLSGLIIALGVLAFTAALAPKMSDVWRMRFLCVAMALIVVGAASTIWSFPPFWETDDARGESLAHVNPPC